ncbi:MAG TPA: FAD-dependent oxidoreductase [Methylomirabilota bacterium]|nr:FAD-dependent oxidoreductase [Methylomirabilota bacterium]
MVRHVIVGAGEAGTRAALALRDRAAGSVTLVGAEPHAPYERPPLSKPEGYGVVIRPIASSFEGIDARFGATAIAIDRGAQTVRLADGGEVPYDRLLIATGARPRPLAADPHGHALALRTRSDAEAIFGRASPGGRAVIVGGGLIGLELAAAFRVRGLAVTVLEAAPRALGRVMPADVAAVLVARHLAEGVDLRLQSTIAIVAADGVTLADGERLAADIVVAAIGVAPETDLAEAAGLEVANGVVVDAGLRTVDPAIFAAGDCAAVEHPAYGRFRFETWRNAVDQGALAARAMMGEDVAFAVHPWFWSDQYDLGVQMVGLHDPARTAVRRDLPAGGFLLFELDAHGALRAAAGIGPGRAAARDVRLAEMLIEKRAQPPAALLADPGIALKGLLRAG